MKAELNKPLQQQRMHTQQTHTSMSAHRDMTVTRTLYLRERGDAGEEQPQLGSLLRSPPFRRR